MRLELSILDDDEDEKIETVQRGSRRELAKKRVQTARKSVKQQKGPSLTVSEDVYQTLHTMGKFLTQPEATVPDNLVVKEQIEPVQIVEQEVIEEPKEIEITTKLENLIEEVRDLEDIIKVEELQHLEEVIKEKEMLLEEVQDLEKAIQEKETLLEEVQNREPVIKQEEDSLEEIKNVEVVTEEVLIKETVIKETESKLEKRLEEIVKESDSKLEKKLEEIVKESENILESLTSLKETESFPKEEETITEEVHEEIDALPVEDDIEVIEEITQPVDVEEKLKSVQDLVNEITIARQKSKAQIEAIVNDAIANSRLDQSLSEEYMEAAIVEQPMNVTLTQKEIDEVVEGFYKHKAPSPIFLDITLDDLKDHIDKQIFLIMEG